MQSDPLLFSNTEFERLALLNKINFSDGHARQELTPSQLEILAQTIDLGTSLKTQGQHAIEDDFLQAFMHLAGQRSVHKKLQAFYAYSSSCSIKIASQICRIKKRKVYLLEPCFDNIRLILTSDEVEVIAISESQLEDPDFLSLTLDASSALWIVQPNNPTGHCLSSEQFKRLISAVKLKGATLIIDFCFRFFSYGLGEWDQYQVLTESGVSFLTIEDTGKTWSYFDNKVGIMFCSPDYSSLVHRFHDELLLNVSPLVLKVLQYFIEETIVNGFDLVRNLIDANRAHFLTLVEEKLLIRASNHSHNVPMELLELPDQLSAIEFWQALRQTGIDILPATNYYWTDKTIGLNKFRIPLSRPASDFKLAVPLIREALNKLKQ